MTAPVQNSPECRPPSASRHGGGRGASGRPREGRAPGSPPRRHILLFSHQLGPSGHTGGFRWHHLIEHMVPLGWRFDVVLSDRAFAAVHGHDYGPAVRLHPVASDGRAGRLRRRLAPWVRRARARRGSSRANGHAPAPPSRDIDVWRSDSRRSPPARLLEAARGAREVLAERAWAARATRVARVRIAVERPGLVVATSPEWLVQLAGAAVSREFDLPYVQDLRDVWFFGRGDALGLAGGVRRRAWRRAEIATARQAVLVIDNTPAANRAAADAIRPHAGTPRIAVPNSMPRIRPVARPDAERFTVAFVGWLYPFMDPRPLLDACARLARRHALDARTLRIRFTGTGEHFRGTPLAALAQACGVGDHFEARGRVPVKAAERLMQDAAVLVVMDHLSGRQVPSKLYHYAQMYGTILPIGTPRAAMAEAAARLGIATIAADDAAALDLALDDALRRWRGRDYAVPNDPEGLYLTCRAASTVDAALVPFAESEAAPDVSPDAPSNTSSGTGAAPRPAPGRATSVPDGHR